MTAGRRDYELGTSHYSFVYGIVGRCIASVQGDQNVHVFDICVRDRPPTERKAEKIVSAGHVVTQIDQFLPDLDPGHTYIEFSHIDQMVIRGKGQVAFARTHINDPYPGLRCDPGSVDQAADYLDVLVYLPPLVALAVQYAAPVVGYAEFSEVRRFRVDKLFLHAIMRRGRSFGPRRFRTAYLRRSVRVNRKLEVSRRGEKVAASKTLIEKTFYRFCGLADRKVLCDIPRFVAVGDRELVAEKALSRHGSDASGAASLR